MSRAQTWLYRKTDGKIGGTFLQGAPVALLTTIGRKTGEPRSAHCCTCARKTGSC